MKELTQSQVYSCFEGSKVKVVSGCDTWDRVDLEAVKEKFPYITFIPTRRRE